VPLTMVSSVSSEKTCDESLSHVHSFFQPPQPRIQVHYYFGYSFFSISCFFLLPGTHHMFYYVTIPFLFIG
jgi:hypothetical protein